MEEETIKSEEEEAEEEKEVEKEVEEEAVDKEQKNIIIDLKIFKIFRETFSFRTFIEDRTIWLYGVVAIYYILMKFVSHSLTAYLMDSYLLYATMIFAGLSFYAVFQLRRKRTPLFEKKRWNYLSQFIVVLGNFLLLVVPGVVFLAKNKIAFDELMRIFLVATWEQLLFAVVVPYSLITAFPLKIKIWRVPIPAFVPAVIISAILFGFAHIFVYSYDLGVVFYLMFLGLIIHTIGFFIPSVSISMHFLHNVLV